MTGEDELTTVDPDISFAHPPVIETVLGVQFDAVPEYRNAHSGAFWETLGSDWPVLEDGPPLLSQFEEFEEGGLWRSKGELGIHVSGVPPIRTKITTQTRNRMIQVQNTRFHYNWLSDEDDGSNYPRYSMIQEEFASYLDRFREFLTSHNLDDITPNQWEVTYRNHIPRGDLWNDSSEWGNVLRLLPNKLDLSTVRQESASCEWHMVIGENLGRLHIQLSHEKISKSDTELLVLLMTARGPIQASDLFEGLDEGLKIGRNSIVTTFKEITTERAHDTWRLEI